ncbi:MAG: hypothetical protein KIT85_16335 [Pseudolabrys sp.]|nr:hypothetical protein [Pseudolabrys sp.]
MRFIVMAFASIALGLALPVTAASAQERTVVIKRDRDHDRGVHRYREHRYDRGLHRGWSRGHHYGWRNHRAEKVVIIKKRRHHQFD